MAMTAAGMAAARKAKIDAVAAPATNDAVGGAAYAAAILQADSEGIVEYIQANAKADITAGSSTGQYSIL